MELKEVIVTKVFMFETIKAFNSTANTLSEWVL